jgi:hypothetical protein
LEFSYSNKTLIEFNLMNNNLKHLLQLRKSKYK